MTKKEFVATVRRAAGRPLMGSEVGRVHHEYVQWQKARRKGREVPDINELVRTLTLQLYRVEPSYARAKF